MKSLLSIQIASGPNGNRGVNVRKVATAVTVLEIDRFQGPLQAEELAKATPVKSTARYVRLIAPEIASGTNGVAGLRAQLRARVVP